MSDNRGSSDDKAVGAAGESPNKSAESTPVLRALLGNTLSAPSYQTEQYRFDPGPAPELADSALRQVFLDPGTADASRPPAQPGDMPILPTDAQYVLTPDRIPAHWIPQTLPRRVRTFGYLPNVEKWLPGDLILVSSTQASRSYLEARTIDWTRRAQTLAGYHAVHARWHHVAMYVDGYHICEALPGFGVRCLPLYNYVGRHMIRVRRDFYLTSDDRYRMVFEALKSIADPYDFRALITMASATLKDLLWERWTQKPDLDWVQRKNRHCSQLYALAYQQVCKKSFAENANQPILPAQLSSTRMLDDVGELGWLQLPT